MNRYPDKAKVHLAPGVQTVSEVITDPLPIINDGIKDYNIIFMIDQLFLVNNCQALVVPNEDNTAITVKIKKTEVKRFVSMLDSQHLSLASVVNRIKDLILQKEAVNPQDDWVNFMRKDVATLAILRSQLEKLLININQNAVTSRMVFLPIANSEFVSRPETGNFASIVDILNSDNDQTGTRLFKDTLRYTPGEIGCGTPGILTKSADISLESKATQRQMMQNQSKDTIYLSTINAVDAFCAPELAVLPLKNNTYLIDMTELAYKYAHLTTFEDDKKLLDYESSLTDQDWFTASQAPPGNKENEIFENTPSEGFTNILTQMWKSQVNTSLGAQEPAGYLTDFGVKASRKYLSKLFPAITVNKVDYYYFDYVYEIIKYSPTAFWKKLGQKTDDKNNDLTPSFKIFLKLLILNWFPNLVRLGQYHISKESISVDTLRTVLGDFNDDYINYLQQRIIKDNIPTTIVLNS